MDVADEHVHVVASPVVDVAETTWVGIVEGLVGHGHAVLRIGIEIVVHVQSVHIVASDDVLYDHASVHAVGFQGGIEDIKVAILEIAVGMFHTIVVGGELTGAFGLGPVGIDPGVQFHATGMTLIHHPCQGIPAIGGGKALLTRQVAAPGLITRLVERVALSTYLEKNGIDTCSMQHVELGGKHLAQLCRRLP